MTGGTVADRVLDDLRRAIVAADLRPGQRVRQEEVAARLDVSLAPVREALRVLEQEGQVEYRPRRGYFITALDTADLVEIYALRRILEERAVRASVPMLDADALERLALAERECAEAAARGDVAAELAANRRFHFGILDAAGQPHTMRLIRLLWDSTEAYRALYYNAPEERDRTVADHTRILEAVREREVDTVAALLDAHRERALEVLTSVLGTPDGA